MRELALEQRVEAIVLRYAEKEATAVVAAKTGQRPEKIVQPENTYAQAAREPRREAITKNRVAERSKSRTYRRLRLLNVERGGGTHLPSYVVDGAEERASAVRKEVWTKVKAKNVISRCDMVTTKQGKVILKPQNKETADVLKSLARSSD